MLFYLFLSLFLILFLILFLLLFLYIISQKKFSKNYSKKFKLGCINLSYILPQIYKNFIPYSLCDLIISQATKKGFNPSQIGPLNMNLTIRKSKTCWLSPSSHTELQSFYNQIQQLLSENDCKIELEELQIVQYSSDEFYNQHYDQCETKHKFCQKELIRFKGPRWITIILYLNDGYEGGETYFPNLNFKFKGKKGDALLFYNLDKSITFIHPKSLHQGMPVIRGQKLIANVWVRRII